MDIQVFESYEALSRQAAGLISAQLEKNKKLLICAATGGSPGGTYQFLAETYALRPSLFDEMNIIKLDEWGGVPLDAGGACETYLQKYLIKPFRIGQSRYISFASDPEDPQQECQRIQEELDRIGPIDICILGLGMNGHIALNEPGEILQSDIHIARLTEQSLTHDMLAAMTTKPSYGLTLGMTAIMQSKMIILLVNGAKKTAVVRKLLTRQISPQFPASFLWLHPNVVCLLDREAAG